MKEITLNAVIENIEAVTDFVNVELERLGCPVKAQFQIDVAIDELFGNIAHYAYSPETGKATVRVEVEPDTTLSLEDRKEGGLGIFLVKKSMDMVEYKYENGNNILIIKKNLR